MSGFSFRNRGVTIAAETIGRSTGLPRCASAGTATASVPAVSHHGATATTEIPTRNPSASPARTMPRQVRVALTSRCSFIHSSGSLPSAAPWRKVCCSATHHQRSCRPISRKIPTPAQKPASIAYRGARAAW